MSRNTGNRKVIEPLQAALTAFLDDHLSFAHSDPEWLEGFNELTQKERDEMAGCGCKCCEAAGYLRGNI